MKKLGLTCALFFGITIASYACENARKGMKKEVETFGKFDSAEKMFEAWDAWVKVAC